MTKKEREKIILEDLKAFYLHSLNNILRQFHPCRACKKLVSKEMPESDEIECLSCAWAFESKYEPINPDEVEN